MYYNYKTLKLPYLQRIETPSFLKIQKVSTNIPFEILAGSFLLTVIHILRALADIN